MSVDSPSERTVIAVDPARAVQGDRVRVVDLGGQYALLLARRIRELGVYAEVVGPEATARDLVEGGRVRALVLSGGPASVYEPGAPGVDPRVYQLGIPVLGVCYGMQLMARDLGGRVRRGERHEFGRTPIQVVGPSRLLRGIPPEQLVSWMSHADVVDEPPPGFSVTASTASTPVAAMEDHQRRLFGVQFHPEVAHTAFGRELLRRFLFDVAGLRPGWTVRSFAELAVDQLREQLGQGVAVVAVSGGVDSTTAALL
ncbi:MAG TPA: glutamine-hydrolyzing GMP synthase, partial [Limnochordales bacterium]